jgi:protein involved in polysaccharide export with SLBB domain
MHLMRRPFMRLAGFLGAAMLAFLTVQPLHAQSVPSADQIELFKNLSPEQQDAILKQLTGGGSGNSSSGLSGDQRNQKGNQSDQAQQNQSSSRRFNDEDQAPLIPVLKPEDSIVIEIDFHLPPRSASQTLQSYVAGTPGLQSAQNLAALQALAAQQGGTTGAGGVLGAPGAAGAGANQQSAQATAESKLTDEERKSLNEMMDLIRSRNPYQLNRDGALVLPGFPVIPLAGLTEEQATLRLSVEPSFHAVEVRVTRLPLKKMGYEALKPFGYELFQGAASAFAPVTGAPVPPDYVVGPGDQLEVQLYGNQNRTLKLTVARDGRISFPELGPITVGGQLFSSVRAGIESRVEKQMIGVRANVSMGETRTLRVFVLGEVRQPGSYTVSSLGTITSALFAAGGVTKIGSLRRIQLKRNGQLVKELDLYDMLMRGDTANDATLLQGDAIFIPPVGPTVAVEGEVRRPAIYEFKKESTVADLVGLAGGLTPQADTANAMLTRVDADERRIVLHVGLDGESAKGQPLRNGDLLHIARLRPTLDAGVVVQGHVFTPGNFAYRSGMRLSDVISSVDELQPNADLHYVLIRREMPPDRRIAVLSADLSAALREPASAANVPLLPRDQITVFDLASGRDRIIKPILDELRRQGSSQHPTEEISIDGRVRVPGTYPLEPGMTVADLIRAGGGLTDAAYGMHAELSRYTIVGGESRRAERLDIDLGAALRGDAASNVKLEPFDDLNVKEIPEWRPQGTVTLSGEVRFPGRYVIKRGETLRAVMARAGGLTEFAFAEGSVFTREELKRREQEQLDMLASRMQTDITVLALQGAAANQAGSASALAVGQSLLGQLKAAKAVGRLVIDLPTTMKAAPGSAMDVVLRDGDLLFVPKLQQQVTVIGEVQTSTSHLYRPELSRDDYIALSGGLTRRADRSKIYVVRANGSVVAGDGGRWFEHGSDVRMKPGDTIVAPLDTERLPALPFWTAVTTIIYNVAIAAAAVHSF